MPESLNIRKINKAIDFIQQHLDQELKVGQLSQVAGISEFHFNRIFHSLMGEPVYQFVKRLRLEMAASLLSYDKQLSILEISMQCGYATPSSFAKSFKQHFGVSAKQWREQSIACSNLNSLVESPKGYSKTIQLKDGFPVWLVQGEDFSREIRIELIPETRIAYVRHVGAYKGDEDLFSNLYSKLFQWAAIHDLIAADTVSLNIYNDNPSITQSGQLRLMVAIPIAETVYANGEVGVTHLAGGRYAVCRLALNKHQFASAWDWLISVWLPESGYVFDHRAAFERCFSITGDNDAIHDVEICIPIKPGS